MAINPLMADQILYWKDPELATKLATLNVKPDEVSKIMQHQGRGLTFGVIPSGVKSGSVVIVSIVAGEMPPAAEAKP